MHPTPKLQEKYTFKIPAIILLNNLGWQYLSPKQALALRAELEKRTFEFEGRERTLSAKAVDTLVAELLNPKLNERLPTANEQLYNHLLYGITVTEFIDGKKISRTIPIIDWDNLDNNAFHFSEEFSAENV